MGPGPVSLLLLFVRPAASAILLATARRTRIGVAMQVLVKSDDAFDYFRRWDTLDVTLRKPLGATLVEVVATGQAPAVKVKALQEDGSAAAMLKPGDIIRSVMGESVAAMGFDGVMAALGAAPDEVRIGVSRAVISREPRVDGGADKAGEGLRQEFRQRRGGRQARQQDGEDHAQPDDLEEPDILRVCALSLCASLLHRVVRGREVGIAGRYTI